MSDQPEPDQNPNLDPTAQIKALQAQIEALQKQIDSPSQIQVNIESADKADTEVGDIITGDKNTAGGDINHTDIKTDGGDVVQRDQIVEGDKVAGDKYEIHNHNTANRHANETLRNNYLDVLLDRQNDLTLYLNLNHPSNSGYGLEVSDVRFERANGTKLALGRIATVGCGQTIYFDRVTQRGSCPVRFNIRNSFGRNFCIV